MYLTRKTKKLFKNISLGLLGLGVIGAIGVGATKIVEHVKDDTKSLSLSYEVGGLNTTNGRYVDDESTIYTKDKFCSIGLKTTLEFDNEINYKIFYYDILDNFISSTDVLSEGYNDLAPTNGAYARIMIIPTNDDDDKISWTEKYDYSKQLNIEVSKKQNIKEKYTSYKGQCVEIVKNTNDLIFNLGTFTIGIGYGESDSKYVSSNVLNVETFKNILVNLNYTPSDSLNPSYSIVEFDSFDLDNATVISSKYFMFNELETFELSKSTKCVIFNVYTGEELSNSNVLNTCFSLSK